MEIKTECGIDIFCLPDNARCRCTGKDPTKMDECPLRVFDNFGLKCVPELCDMYEE